MKTALNKEANIYLIEQAQYLTEAELRAIYSLNIRLGGKNFILVGSGDRHYTKLYNLARYAKGFVTQNTIGYFGLADFGMIVAEQLLEQWGPPVTEAPLFEFAENRG